MAIQVHTVTAYNSLYVEKLYSQHIQIIPVIIYQRKLFGAYIHVKCEAFLDSTDNSTKINNIHIK